MTNQSQIDTFVGQAKARLDEMGAAAKEFEAQLNTLDAQIRPEAEQAIAKIQEWVKEGEAKLKELSEKGEASLAEAQAYIEKVWAEFETEAAKWVDIANSQRATFEAQARAQLQSWQGMVDECLKRASEVQESGKANAEAEIVRLKGEAKKAEAHIDELRKAGEASWSVMSKGLEQSRSAFEKAAKQAWSEFSKTAKG
jgi:Na+/phosphate symporter